MSSMLKSQKRTHDAQNRTGYGSLVDMNGTECIFHVVVRNGLGGWERTTIPVAHGVDIIASLRIQEVVRFICSVAKLA